MNPPARAVIATARAGRCWPVPWQLHGDDVWNLEDQVPLEPAWRLRLRGVASPVRPLGGYVLAVPESARSSAHTLGSKARPPVRDNAELSSGVSEAPAEHHVANRRGDLDRADAPAIDPDTEHGVAVDTAGCQRNIRVTTISWCRASVRGRMAGLKRLSSPQTRPQCPCGSAVVTAGNHAATTHPPTPSAV